MSHAINEPALVQFVEQHFHTFVLPTLIEYVKIPNMSPGK